MIKRGDYVCNEQTGELGYIVWGNQTKASTNDEIEVDYAFERDNLTDIDYFNAYTLENNRDCKISKIFPIAKKFQCLIKRILKKVF